MADFSTETDKTSFDISSRESARSLILELIKSARREICFFGGDIDKVLFDTPEAIESISEFARRNSKTTIKFVVDSTQQNTANGHRILALAQRLTTAIHIRNSAIQHKDENFMYLLIDDNAYAYFPSRHQYDGYGDNHDPAKVRTLKKQFEKAWDHSQADSNIRRLGL